MLTFQSHGRHFVNATKRRVIYESIALALLAGVMCLPWSTLLPGWIRLALPGAFAMYIALGLALYPTAKRAASSLSIRLLDDALQYSDSKNAKAIPYRDFSISNVERNGDQIESVELTTSWNQRIVLSDFEEMNDLYALLAERIKPPSPK